LLNSQQGEHESDSVSSPISGQLANGM